MNETYRRKAGAGSITVNPALGAVLAVVEGGRVRRPRVGEGHRGLRLPVRARAEAGARAEHRSSAAAGHQRRAHDQRDAVLGELLLRARRSTIPRSSASSPGCRSPCPPARCVIGGWPFFKAARARAASAGMLHLDLPIADGHRARLRHVGGAAGHLRGRGRPRLLRHAQHLHHPDAARPLPPGAHARAQPPLPPGGRRRRRARGAEGGRRAAS